LIRTFDQITENVVKSDFIKNDDKDKNKNKKDDKDEQNCDINGMDIFKDKKKEGELDIVHVVHGR